ncbi:MAG: hypothetical protein SGBAC_002426 [Bacillariaceae sp.]
MTSIHHDIVFRKEGIAGWEKADEIAAGHQVALAAGQFAFVEDKNNKGVTDGDLADTRNGQSARRLLGNNLYSSFRKKSKVVERTAKLTSKSVEAELPVAPEGIAFIPSHISLREGSLVSDLNTSSRHTLQIEKSKPRDPPGERPREDPSHPQSPDRHVPARIPVRRSSFGTMAPEPPKLRELIEGSGILDEISMQKGGSMKSILEEGLNESDWQQLSKKTQRAVSAAIDVSLHEVLRLENYPSFHCASNKNTCVQRGRASGHSASNGSGSGNEWLSFGDTTISSRSFNETSSQEEWQDMKQRRQRASSEPDSESSRPLPSKENDDRIGTRSQDAIIPPSRSLSISSRYEPSVSSIPDGIELDVLPSELDNTSLLKTHRREASDDLQNSDFLLSDDQLQYLNRKDSTQSTVSEITTDTNAKTSGRSILSTPPATPMVLNPRAPQLLMAQLQGDPSAHIDAFPRPPIALESPTPPMRKCSPDDDQLLEGVAARAENSSSAMPALRPYARKGTLTQSGRAQLHEMEPISEVDDSLEKGGTKGRKPVATSNDEADVENDTDEMSTSESADPQPISLRGPFANDKDAAPIQLGGLLRPQDNSNPLLFPAPLISDDEDDEHFEDESDLEQAISPGAHTNSSKSRTRDLFNAATATPSVSNRRKVLSNKYVATKQKKETQNSNQDSVFDSSDSSIDLETEKAPLHDAIDVDAKLESKTQLRSNVANYMEPSKSVGQFRLLNPKSNFRYPKPPSDTALPAMGEPTQDYKKAAPSKVTSRSHTEEDVDDLSSSDESTDPPPVSLRGPFANDSEAAPRPLGGLLRPQEDSNPQFFPAPLMSDNEDGVCFEDESDVEAPPAPETTFIPPSPVDPRRKIESRRQKVEQIGDSKRATRLKAASTTSSPYQLNVFNPSSPPEAMGNVFDSTKRSSFQSTDEGSHCDILFDASTHSIGVGGDAQEPESEKQSNCNEFGEDDETIPQASKIESTVFTDGQVDEQFCFRGLEDGVRVKLCPAQIGYLLNGKAHVHSGYYSGPLNAQCRMHGNGMFWFTSGDTYLGQFQNGELHGAGMMSVTDDETGTKQVFSGFFCHNKYVGDEVVDDDSTYG